VMFRLIEEYSLIQDRVGNGVKPAADEAHGRDVALGWEQPQNPDKELICKVFQGFGLIAGLRD